MLSIKKSVATIVAGLTASIAFPSASWAVGVTVNHESQTVQTPTAAGESGISYVQTGSTTSALKVYTSGFLFCGNPGDSISSAATLVFAHEDQAFSPAHPWMFLTATDAPAVVYTGGTLSINAASPTSLTCLGTAADGAVASGTTEGIFDNGYDSPTATNYSHLINWIPPQGFDWSNPDWTQVPVDPCSPDGTHPARVIEDVACAAVSGVRSAATGGTAERASSIWTATDGITFTYLFRFDARFGPQLPGAAPEMQLPDTQGIADADTATSVQVVIRDAFDKAFLGSASGDGQFCLLTTFPSVLNSTVCSGAQSYPLDGQPLNQTVNLGIPPAGDSSRSFYVAVLRPVIGGHQILTTPVVAASALVERSVVAEGGDKFRGDDVVFGFMPSSTGFPWMTGQ